MGDRDDHRTDGDADTAGDDDRTDDGELPPWDEFRPDDYVNQPEAPPPTANPEAAGEGDAGTEYRGVTLDGSEEEDEDEDEETFWSAYGGTGRTERNTEAALTRPGAGVASFENISRADLREHYGPIRTLFKRRERAYTAFQRQLIQAWIPRTYDQYLARVVARMVVVLAVGVALAVLVGGGLLAGWRAGVVPRRLPGVGVPVGTAAALAAGVAVAGGVVGAATYWTYWRVVRVRARIARRRSEINYNLPYAVTFMYALARADVSFDRIITRLADSKGAYGAVAQEFDRVVRDVETFGNNVYVGLENLREVTPSEELRRFTDDVMTVLETGGDLAGFLRDEVDAQLETAVAEQESFIEQLELLAEVFVVGFVAAPLFVLVVLIVVSFLGAETLGVIGVIVYAGIPLALAGFVVLVDSLGEAFRPPPVSFGVDRGAVSAPPESADDPNWRGRYEREKQLSGVRNRLLEQVERVAEEPWRALVFSVPVGLALPVAGVLTGVMPFGLAALRDNPVQVTTELVVLPAVVALLPVAVVHEQRRRREIQLQQRFPDLLELLATSNRRGLSLTRGLDIITDSTSGRLGEELRTLRNDIRWNADLPAAFEAFGDRLSSPALTRSVNLIAEGSRATSDLHVVLEVAARDLSERARLERERRQTLQSYLVIVVVGFLVYLLVVLLLAANFLDPLEAFSADVATEGPVSLGSVPVEELRVVLFHSALIQGFGSGLLAGKLAENSLYSGLKYGIGLSILAVVAFTVV